MATRATIVLQIPTDKVGKTYLYPEGGKNHPTVTIPEGSKYVEVYHHWDGYPDWLGEKLINPDNGFNNFDTIMTRLIACGSMSCIGIPYHAKRGEDWENVKPVFTPDIPEVSEIYQYLFNTDENKWYVRSYETVFRLVPDVIDENEEEE